MSSRAESQNASTTPKVRATPISTTRKTFGVQCKRYALALIVSPSTVAQWFETEPNTDEIRKAVENLEFEETPYSDHSQELTNGWWQECGGNLDDLLRRSREYHARRIAFFVVNKWTEPIILDWNENMVDGTHRLKAARYLNWPEVEVLINPPPAPAAEPLLP